MEVSRGILLFSVQTSRITVEVSRVTSVQCSDFKNYYEGELGDFCSVFRLQELINFCGGELGASGKVSSLPMKQCCGPGSS